MRSIYAWCRLFSDYFATVIDNPLSFCYHVLIKFDDRRRDMIEIVEIRDVLLEWWLKFNKQNFQLIHKNRG
jgi:hypothetical protein